ncbi:hypothetical protein BDV95DRAFT_614409 [Massariosphaeria phaeospora]|uniref:Uncharacterized protein n=1 Tax=Massariosphaeria phaeospora TaxID=100035 RepID=A0A7C8MFT3_9PLEO|nr:hypothetical protein BDV95DRAFT_614409 [Massariosphaeria phaeospora]
MSDDGESNVPFSIIALIARAVHLPDPYDEDPEDQESGGDEASADGGVPLDMDPPQLPVNIPPITPQTPQEGQSARQDPQWAPHLHHAPQAPGFSPPALQGSHSIPNITHQTFPANPSTPQFSQSAHPPPGPIHQQTQFTRAPPASPQPRSTYIGAPEQPVATNGQLRYPVERYIPPPSYYDCDSFEYAIMERNHEGSMPEASPDDCSAQGPEDQTRYDESSAQEFDRQLPLHQARPTTAARMSSQVHHPQSSSQHPTGNTPGAPELFAKMVDLFEQMAGLMRELGRVIDPSEDNRSYIAPPQHQAYVRQSRPQEHSPGYVPEGTPRPYFRQSRPPGYVTQHHPQGYVPEGPPPPYIPRSHPQDNVSDSGLPSLDYLIQQIASLDELDVD